MTAKGFTRGALRHLACFIVAQIIFGLTLFISTSLMQVVWGDKAAMGGFAAISFLISLSVAIYGYVILNRFVRDDKTP